jgi:hypothetical protein
MIIVNTIILACIWYPMPPGWDTAQSILNDFFTVFFALELIIKLTGLGVRWGLPGGCNRDGFRVLIAAEVRLPVRTCFRTQCVRSMCINPHRHRTLSILAVLLPRAAGPTAWTA